MRPMSRAKQDVLRNQSRRAPNRTECVHSCPGKIVLIFCPAFTELACYYAEYCRKKHGKEVFPIQWPDPTDLTSVLHSQAIDCFPQTCIHMMGPLRQGYALLETVKGHTGKGCVWDNAAEFADANANVDVSEECLVNFTHWTMPLVSLETIVSGSYVEDASTNQDYSRGAASPIIGMYADSRGIMRGRKRMKRVKVTPPLLGDRHLLAVKNRVLFVELNHRPRFIYSASFYGEVGDGVERAQSKYLREAFQPELDCPDSYFKLNLGKTVMSSAGQTHLEMQVVTPKEIQHLKDAKAADGSSETIHDEFTFVFNVNRFGVESEPIFRVVVPFLYVGVWEKRGPLSSIVQKKRYKKGSVVPQDPFGTGVVNTVSKALHTGRVSEHASAKDWQMARSPDDMLQLVSNHSWRKHTLQVLNTLLVDNSETPQNYYLTCFRSLLSKVELLDLMDKEIPILEEEEEFEDSEIDFDNFSNCDTIEIAASPGGILSPLHPDYKHPVRSESSTTDSSTTSSPASVSSSSQNSSDPRMVGSDKQLSNTGMSAAQIAMRSGFMLGADGSPLWSPSNNMIDLINPPLFDEEDQYLSVDEDNPVNSWSSSSTSSSSHSKTTSATR